MHHAVVARTTVVVLGGAGAGRALPLAIGALSLALTLGLLAVAWRRAARRRPA